MGKINTENLEPTILDLFHKSSYKEKALEIKSSIEKEDFQEKILSCIEQGYLEEKNKEVLHEL